MRIIIGLLQGILFTISAAGLSEAGIVRHVNRTDATCGGASPCYRSIQAAVNAAQPGDTVQIQSGSYVEQLSVIAKNATATSPATRIVIQADPTAAVGSVVLRGAVDQCAGGHGILVRQSRFVTIRGLTITGAGGAAIALAGGTDRNLSVHIERNRIVGNGATGCDGGITIGAGNSATLIVNNLVLANGRNGIATLDGEGGPHTLVQNTIHGNGWNGVSATRSHVFLLINNAITGNGTHPGSTGGRVGVRREAAPLPLAIVLRNNLICGNRLGEIAGPVLDGADGVNLTPAGAEGPGVTASAGCDNPALVYRDLAGADHASGSLDDDPAPAAGSPLIDRGLDPRTMLTPDLNALFEADYSGESVRPTAGSVGGPARFDIGAAEARSDGRPPAVVFQVPAANAHLRGTVTVQAQATDADGAVATVTLRGATQELTATLAPQPPANPIIATASWSTATVTDGIHTLTATAIDQFQNAGTASRTVIVDNAPPDTQILGGPVDTVSEPSAVFTFAGTDNLTAAAGLAFAWRLDGGAFTPFAAITSAALPGLGAGSHVFEVKARDLAGNEDPSPARRTFTVGGGMQVTITEPAVGAVVPSGVLLVRGTVAPGGIDAGVTVNGIVAARQGGSFAAMVPVAAPSVTLTAVATTESGDTATHAVTAAVSDLGENALALRAHPGTGAVPLMASFFLIGGPVPARVEVDFDGDGRTDFDGPTLDGQTFTYTAPGLFYPRVRVVDDQGAAFTATGLVQVVDPAALEALLQGRWSGLRDALNRADVPAAVSLFAGASRDAYRDQLTSLAAVGALPQVAAALGAIAPVKILDRAAEYELKAVQQGTLYSFHVLFVIDTDGVWRLRVF
ncbi:MAG TPA: right-handed parallel beta-helix repeat-containing protein [Methylomirabilota bacterium]|nr:right-handed parallel beta-helix repeat-containing protein [Methylomirabilota bacterium]